MISPDTIAEWKRVIAAATPGPWAARAGGENSGFKYPPHVVRDWHDDEGRKCTTFIADSTDSTGRDAAFIALARTAFPELLEAYEALQAENERLETVVHGVNRIRTTTVNALRMEHARAKSAEAERDAKEARIVQILIKRDKDTALLRDKWVRRVEKRDEETSEWRERARTAEGQIKGLRAQVDELMTNDYSRLLKNAEMMRKDAAALNAQRESAEARVRELEAEVKWLRGDTGGIRWGRTQP